MARLGSGDYLLPSRQHESPHISTRQYARSLQSWIADIGHDPSAYSTHSLRRTKATLIYRRTKNLRAVQLLLGHTKLESTARYLRIEVEDALEISERTDAWVIPGRSGLYKEWLLSARSRCSISVPKARSPICENQAWPRHLCLERAHTQLQYSNHLIPATQQVPI